MDGPVTYHWLDETTAEWLNGTDVFDEAVQSDQLAAFLGDAGHLMQIACIGNRVVGFASGTVLLHPDKPKSLFVNEVEVLEAFRRRGIAAGLLTRLVDHARADGCATVWLATEGDNDAARGLYRSLSGKEQSGVVVYEW